MAIFGISQRIGKGRLARKCIELFTPRYLTTGRLRLPVGIVERSSLAAVGADTGLLPPLPRPLAAERGGPGLADIVHQPEEVLVDVGSLFPVGSGPQGGQLEPAPEGLVVGGLGDGVSSGAASPVPAPPGLRAGSPGPAYGASGYPQDTPLFPLLFALKASTRLQAA